MTLLLLAKKAYIALAVLNSGDMECRSTALYFEGRSEPLIAQYAIAQVIQNRIDSPKYPDTACEVVHAPKAFYYYWDGKSERITDRKAYNQALIVSALVMWGWVPDQTGNATHYHTINTKPYWSNGEGVVVGSQVFLAGVK